MSAAAPQEPGGLPIDLSGAGRDLVSVYSPAPGTSVETKSRPGSGR